MCNMSASARYCYTTWPPLCVAGDADLKYITTLEVDGDMVDVYDQFFDSGKMRHTIWRDLMLPLTTISEQVFDGGE